MFNFIDKSFSMLFRLAFICFFLFPINIFSQNIDFYQKKNEIIELYNSGNYQNVIDSVEKYQKMMKENKKENTNLFANFSTIKASALKDLSKYDEAFNSYQESLRIFKTINHIPEYYQVYSLFAKLLSVMGKYDECHSILKECLSKTDSLYGKNSIEYVKALVFISANYFSSGDYQKSIEYSLVAKQICEKGFGTDIEIYRSLLHNLAAAYRQSGEYSKVDEINIKLENRPLNDHLDSLKYSATLMNQASYQQSLGNNEEAYRFFFKSKALMEALREVSSENYIVLINNIGSFFSEIGLYSHAESYLMESVKLRAQFYGTDHPLYATAMNNLGNLYRVLKKYNTAERLYLECLRVREKTLSKTHPYYASILNNLALVYASTNRHEKAKQFYKKSLSVNEIALGKKHWEYTNNLRNLARVYWKTNDLDSADFFYHKANSNFNSDIDENFAYQSEKQKEKYISISQDFFSEFKAYSFFRKETNPSIIGDVYDNELKHKGIILSTCNAMREAIEGGNNRELKKMFKQFVAIKDLLSKQYSLSISERTMNTDSLEIIKEKKEKELNRRLLDNGMQHFMNKNISWQDIQNKLADDEIAIEFCRFDNYRSEGGGDSVLYAALILRKKDEYPQMVHLFEESQLKKLLTRPESAKNDYYYISPIYKISPDKITKSDSLFQYILKPVMPFLKGIKRIYLSPVGLLHSISFAAIPLDKKNLLNDKYEIVYLTNTKNILNIDQVKDIKKATIYGGIKYQLTDEEKKQVESDYTNNEVSSSIVPVEIGKTRGVNWSYLEGALKEADTISNILQNKLFKVNLLTNKKATEASFKKMNNDSPDIIHIATHGFFFSDEESKKLSEQVGNINFVTSENPLLRSGLMFAGGSEIWNGEIPKRGMEDGVLTAYEISNLNLSNTKIAVLSACQTGLGKVDVNEGVYGMRRAFKMAGVDFMIMSLWSIPDKQTAELMTRFYSYFLISKDIRKAFYQAQNELRKKYSAFGWAAFVLIY